MAQKSTPAGGSSARLPAHAPDVLHRPLPGPCAIDLVAVAARRVGRRTQLQQALDEQAVGAEEGDPLAVGQLEGDRLARLLKAAQLLPVAPSERCGRMLCAGGPGEVE